MGRWSYVESRIGSDDTNETKLLGRDFSTVGKLTRGPKSPKKSVSGFNIHSPALGNIALSLLSARITVLLKQDATPAVT